MSRWSTSRLALAGWVVAASAASALATDVVVAPMPHTPAKPFLTIPFIVNFDCEETLAPATVQAAPNPTPVRVAPPCCAFDRCEAAPSQLAATNRPVVIPQPTKPANVPAEAFDVMAGVFGEMLNAKPGAASSPVQPTAYAVPVPAPTVVAPPCPLPTTAKSNMTGTWVREIGPIVYVVKVAPDHVTITATTSVEASGGKTYTEGVVLTADYHMTRDGTTLVGLITSVDAVIEGTMPTDGEMSPNGSGEELSRIQKLLVDKPLAFNVRLYGDTLAIGNVRLPDLEGARGPCYPLTVIGGRYSQHGDKPLPKPKAVKMYPREILPTPLTAVPPPGVPNTYYLPPPPPPPIQQTGGTLPPLPLNVPDYPVVNPQTSIPIPTPGTLPVELNKLSLPAIEKGTAPSPQEVQKPRKKGKKTELHPERIHGGIM